MGLVAQAVPELLKQSSIPLFEHEFEDGTSIHITPAGIVAVGGGLALGSVGLILYQIYKEGSMSFLGGKLGLFGTLAQIGLSTSGAPLEIIRDLADGGGAPSLLGNMVKYSNPVFFGADLAGVPVDETVEKGARWIGRKIGGLF